MCCRLILTVDEQFYMPDIEVWLRIAGFQPNEDFRTYWTRYIDEEKASVRLRKAEAGLEFSLYPSVTNYQGHLNKRLAASLMFQTAALIAERLSGSITQHATVEGCIAERPSIAVVGSYPDHPFLFENACRGFREVLLGGGVN